MSVLPSMPPTSLLFFFQSLSEAISTQPSMPPTSVLFSPYLKRCLRYLLCHQHCSHSVLIWSDVCATFYATNIAAIQYLSEAMSMLPSMLPTLQPFSPYLKRCLCYLLCYQHCSHSVPLWSDVYATFYTSNISPIQSLSAAMFMILSKLLSVWTIG